MKQVSPDSNIVVLIREAMAARGYNQTQLAKAAGLAKQTISNLLAGRRRPAPVTCLKLARALRINPLSLLDLTGRIPPQGFSLESIDHIYVSDTSEDLPEPYPLLQSAYFDARRLPLAAQRLLAAVMRAAMADPLLVEAKPNTPGAAS